MAARRVYIREASLLVASCPQAPSVFSGMDLRTKPDFLAKMTIASKEANETAYWLSLLHDNGYLTDLQLSSLDNDMQRILCKLIAIVKTTKENLEKRK